MYTGIKLNEYYDISNHYPIKFLNFIYIPESIGLTIYQMDMGAKKKDIDKREHAETLLQKTHQLLKQTRQNYLSFFNSIDEFLLVLDKKAHIVHTNATVIKRLGYTREELAGKSVLMLHPPERQDEAANMIDKILNGEAAFCPVPLMTKSGIQIPVETRVFPGHWDQKPVIFKVSKDMSRIELSEEKFSKLFYMNPSGCVLIDLHNHMIIEVNEAFCRLLGYDQSEVIGKTCESLGICKAETLNKIEKSTDNKGTVEHSEVTLKSKNGVQKQVILYSENLYIQDKKYRFTVTNDITQLRETTEELIKAKEKAEESEVKYKQLYDNTLDHIFILDVTEDQRFKVLAVNPIQQKETGELCPGTYIEDCLKKENYNKVVLNYQRCIAENKIISYEEVFNDRDFLTQLIPVRDKHGRIYRIIGIARNITKEKILLKQLVVQNQRLRLLNKDLTTAKEKAEESDRLKTAFLHNISHEIRTPLNAIIGFSSLLSNPGLSDEKRKEYFDIIKVSNNQLLSIITGIISLSSLEAGTEQINETETNINEILLNVYEQFLVTRIPLGINFSYHPTLPDELAYIYTDQVKLMQILVNLVGNALKFTYNGKVSFGYTLTKGVLRFFVEDTGVGIHKNMQQKVFERFRQLDNTTTRQHGGTGLGLALSKGYVEMLGGKITLTSEPGKGSVFIFTLPYKKVVKTGTAVATNFKTPEIILPKEKTILVAEDEVNSFRLINELLTSLNLRVVHANNGLEAVNSCTGNKLPDLVLMDIKMPVMDGIDATKKIKESNPGLPVVALTAYVLDNEKKRILESGCDDYLEKPIHENAIIELLSKYLTK